MNTRTDMGRFAPLREQLKTALIYPALLLCVGVVIVFFFMTVLLPKFTAIFNDFNIDLPISTKVLIGISNFLTDPIHMALLFGLSLAAVGLMVLVRSTPAGCRWLDHCTLRIPMLGRLIRLDQTGQFTQRMAALMRDGENLNTALEIVENDSQNRAVREAIKQTREAMTKGMSFAEALAASGIFPQSMIDRIKTGENSGDVVQSLEDLSDDCDRELNVAIRFLNKAIEPGMIVLIALGVGFLLFSVLQAMFMITGNIGVNSR